MAEKSGYTKKETDWLGREKEVHYNKDGQKIGETRFTTDWRGRTIQEHYDRAGREIGETRKGSDWLGRDRAEHFDNQKRRIGHSRNEIDAWGRPIQRHYDESERQIGASRKSEDWLMRPRKEHEGRYFKGSPPETEKSRRSRADTSYDRSAPGGSGGTGGCSCGGCGCGAIAILLLTCTLLFFVTIEKLGLEEVLKFRVQTILNPPACSVLSVSSGVKTCVLDVEKEISKLNRLTKEGELIKRKLQYPSFYPSVARDPEYSKYNKDYLVLLLYGEIEILATKGNYESRRIRLANESPPARSPDGSIIAFASNDGYIYLMTRDGLHSLKVAKGRSPRWSSDGTKIVFTRGRD